MENRSENYNQTGNYNQKRPTQPSGNGDHFPTDFFYKCSPADYFKLIRELLKGLNISNEYVKKLNSFIKDPFDKMAAREDILEGLDYSELFSAVKVSDGLKNIVLNYKDDRNMKQILFYSVIKAIDTKEVVPMQTYSKQVRQLPPVNHEMNYFESRHSELYKNCGDYTIFDIFESRVMKDVVGKGIVGSEYFSYEYYVNNKVEIMNLVKYMHFAAENENRWNRLAKLYKNYLKNDLQDLDSILSLCFWRDMDIKAERHQMLATKLLTIVDRVLALEEVQCKFEHATLLLELVGFNYEPRELFLQGAEGRFRSVLAGKFDRLKQELDQALKERMEHMQRVQLGQQVGEYALDKYRFLLEVGLTKLYNFRDIFFYYKFQTPSAYEKDSFEIIMKSIGILKQELLLMRHDKTVLIENNIDTAQFQIQSERQFNLVPFKIVRQNDKDVLILD